MVSFFRGCTLFNINVLTHVAVAIDTSVTDAVEVVVMVEVCGVWMQEQNVLIVAEAAEYKLVRRPLGAAARGPRATSRRLAVGKLTVTVVVVVDVDVDVEVVVSVTGTKFVSTTVLPVEVEVMVVVEVAVVVVKIGGWGNLEEQ